MELQVLKIFSILFGLIVGVPIILGFLGYLSFGAMAAFSTVCRRTVPDGGTGWGRRNREEAEAPPVDRRCDQCHGTGWVQRRPA